MSDRGAERRAFAARAVAGARVPVARILPSDLLTPVLLFQRLRAPGAESFLLESVEGGENVARYTFLGASPSARLTVRDGRTCLERRGAADTLEGAPLAILDRLVRSAPFVADPDLPPLAAGAVGYLSYDAVRLFEAIPDRHRRRGDLPDALFALYDAVIAFDHPRQRLLLLTTIDTTEGRSAEAAAEEAIARLMRFRRWSSGRSRPGRGSDRNRCPPPASSP
jgi:anthranilate synthase component 1